MGNLSIKRVLAGGALLTTAYISAAAAHHGWSWAEADQMELAGTIQDIYIGPPHPSLQVETAEDGVWTVELANPRQTEKSGFAEGSAQAGDKIVVIGNRAQNADEKRMKAVRITIDDRSYDLYPERIQKR